MRRTILAALAILMAGTSASLAVEKLKVAIPQKGFWDSSWVEFGEAAGFFKEAGLEVEVFYTEGGAQTIATVASGSVDIAMSNGILGAIGAYVKGGEATPYRIISAEMTGANELFWWVKADSPIKTPQGRRRQDHRLLVAGLVVEPDPADAAQADRLQGQADPDRRRARDLHPDHDRPDRHRLVGGAVRARRTSTTARSASSPARARPPSWRTRPSAPTSPASIRSRPSAKRSPSSCR